VIIYNILLMGWLFFVCL